MLLPATRRWGVQLSRLYSPNAIGTREMFWDSSSLIPLLLPESRSAALTAVFNADDHPVIWWVTPVECHSALARLVRDKVLPRDDARRAIERLRRFESRSATRIL